MYYSSGGIISPNKVTIIKDKEDNSSIYYNVTGDIITTDIPSDYESLFGDIQTLDTDGSEYIILNIDLNALIKIGHSKVPSMHALSAGSISGTALSLYKDKEGYQISENGILNYSDAKNSILYNNNTSILTLPMSCVNKQHQAGTNDIITITFAYGNDGVDYKEVHFYIQKV